MTTLASRDLGASNSALYRVERLSSERRTGLNGANAFALIS